MYILHRKLSVFILLLNVFHDCSALKIFSRHRIYRRETVEVINEEPPPTVKIPQGNLVGTYELSRSGSTFASFKGIPFGNVPQRFSAPIPPRPWKEQLFNATSYGPRCPQLHKGAMGVGQAEECLFLNVFVPKKFPLNHANNNACKRKFPTKSNLLPVMVLMETGGFQSGGGDHSGPMYFMDEEIILITFNYRMNIFGFLSTNDMHARGNNGLKDQHLALVWVQKNIAFFGGNPDAVTIFGESAGGSSVSYHLLLPASQGLFRGAISQSGSALISRHFTSNLVSATDAFASRVGCPSTKANATTSQAMINCLRGKGVAELLKGLKPEGNVLEVPAQIFVPTLEPGFLPSSPLTLLRSGKFSKVPLVLTITKDEGLLRDSARVIKSSELLSQLNKDWYSVSPIAFGNYEKLSLSSSTRNFISTKIREFYFPNNVEIGIDTFANLTALYSDAGVMSGVKQLALFHAQKAPVYAAVFAYEGIWSAIFSLGYTQPLGVAHTDDLQYLFNNEVYPTFSPRSRVEKISKSFVKSWVQFAWTGIPGDLEHSSSAESSWRRLGRKEHETGDINWLYLQDTPQRHLEPLRSRLKFWDFINTIIEFDLIFKF